MSKQSSLFNTSEHANSFSTRVGSDCSAEFLPYPSGQGMKKQTQKHSELTKEQTEQLSAEELDIIKQVDVLAFDQAGCRMI